MYACVCVRACVCTQTGGVHTLHNLELLIEGRTRQLSPRTGEGVPIKERQLVMLHVLTSNHTNRHCHLQTHASLCIDTETHTKRAQQQSISDKRHTIKCALSFAIMSPYALVSFERKESTKREQFSPSEIFSFCMWVQKRCFTLHSVAEIQRNSNLLCCAAVTCTLPLWRRSDPQAEVRASVTRP